MPVGGLAAADTSTVSLELTGAVAAGDALGRRVCGGPLAASKMRRTNCSAELEITVVISADLVVSAAVSTEAAGYDNRIFPQWLPFTPVGAGKQSRGRGRLL